MTISDADKTLARLLTPEVLSSIVDLVPGEWLEGEPGFADAAEVRDAYVEFLLSRLEEPRLWVQAVEEAVGKPFEYAILRVVPRVERGECINAGVVLYCQEEKFLAARVHLDAERLLVLDPAADLETVRAHLEAVHPVCAGSDEAGAVGRMPKRERFG